MKCPKCGADNPDSAEFCSLCTERLTTGAPTAPGGIPEGAPGDIYMAPGEWRGGTVAPGEWGGDTETLSPEVSKVVVAKLHKFRIRLTVYAVLIVIIVVWLVLSFTVWGNPSAGDQAMKLIDAVNSRNEEAFLDLFQERNRSAAEEIYATTVAYLGGNGRYEDVKLVNEQQDVYEMIFYFESGTVQAGGGTKLDISRSDNLMIVLENQRGRWYVVPRGTDIIP